MAEAKVDGVGAGLEKCGAKEKEKVLTGTLEGVRYSPDEEAVKASLQVQ